MIARNVPGCAGAPQDVSFRCISSIHSLDTSERDIRGGVMSSRKGAGVLELAVLGLLHETPMHGYELRKRLNTLLGMFRAFSYGTLYPCLKQLLAQGLIAEELPDEDDRIVPSRRSKIVYRLTA